MPEGPKSAVFQSPDSGLYCPGPSSSSSRGPPSPVQDGRRDRWDRRDKSPDDRRLVFDVISTRWLTISALWDYCLCQIGQQSLCLRLPSLQSRLLSLHTDCLCNLGRLSPPSGSAYQRAFIPLLGPLYLSIYQLFHIYLREEIQQKISQVSFSLTYAPREINGAYIYIYRKKIYL